MCITNDFPYMVILDDEYREEIPLMTTEQVEQFKKDVEVYSNDS